jgi:hypothetical protein
VLRVRRRLVKLGRGNSGLDGSLSAGSISSSGVARTWPKIRDRTVADTSSPVRTRTRSTLVSDETSWLR